MAIDIQTAETMAQAAHSSARAILHNTRGRGAKAAWSLSCDALRALQEAQAQRHAAELAAGHARIDARLARLRTLA